MNRLKYLHNVTTLQLDPTRCIGCGMCTVVCPHAVFFMTDRQARISDPDLCMECGACAMNCPAEAIRVSVGVGCAQAVINSALGRQGNGCCCVIEENTAEPGKPPPCC